MASKVSIGREKNITEKEHRLERVQGRRQLPCPVANDLTSLFTFPLPKDRVHLKIALSSQNFMVCFSSVCAHVCGYIFGRDWKPQLSFLGLYLSIYLSIPQKNKENVSFLCNKGSNKFENRTHPGIKISVYVWNH